MLRSGKYGLFYGCEHYPKTRCRGSVSANSQGVAISDPVDAATREARYRLLKALEHVDTEDAKRALSYSLEECQQRLAALIRHHSHLVEYLNSLPVRYERTRLERLLADDMLPT